MINRIASLLRIQVPGRNPGILRADGDGAPSDGESGYAKSCLFHDTANATVYVNEGTVESTTWKAVTTSS